MKCRKPQWLLALVGFALSKPVPTVAQPPVQLGSTLPSAIRIDAISARSRGQLARVAQLIAARRWPQAVAALRQGFNNSDSRRLVQVASQAGVQLHVPLQQASHQVATAWRVNAPKAYQILRRQLSEPARVDLEKALSSDSSDGLNKVFLQYWSSSSGDDAALALADKAIERGHYESARAYLLRLHPSLTTTAAAQKQLGLPSDRAWGWVLARRKPKMWERVLQLIRESGNNNHSLATHPETDIPLAQVWSRLAFISILSRDYPRAEIEIKLLGRLYPQAEGQLGKKKGKLAFLLQELLTASLGWKRPPADSDWPMFGRDAGRGSHANHSLHIARRPIWRARLSLHQSTDEYFSERVRRVGESKARLISYHPVIAGGRVYIATGSHRESIRAIDLETGQRIWPRTTPPTVRASMKLRKPRRPAGVARFTLTVAKRLLLARVGSQRSGIQPDETSAKSRNRIVVLDLDSEGKLASDPIRTPGRSWSFEGAPLVADGLVITGLRHRDQVRSTLHVAAFDLRNGRQVWRSEVVSAEAPAGGFVDEVSHCMLSAAAGRIYINSGLGAVACLSGESGHIIWLSTYAREFDRAGDVNAPRLHLFRDLVPCLVAAGQVVAAPPDSPDIFCFSASSGRLLWRSRVADAVHVLGMGDDHLIVSGHCLYWLDFHTGKIKSQFPTAPAPGYDLAHDAPRGWGRGLLAGKQIWWPAKDNIFIFRQKTIPSGRRWQSILVDKIDLVTMGVQSGNLVMSNGVLLVAGASQLTAFNQYGRIVGQPRGDR